MEMIIIGLVSGLGILLMLLKLDFPKVLGFDLVVDIGATLLLMVAYAGTLGGMIAAMVGGLQISVVLLLAKKLMGYMKPKFKRDGFKFTIEWTPQPGLLYNKHMAKAQYYDGQVRTQDVFNLNRDKTPTWGFGGK